MKYGVLVNRGTQNLGDDIQSYAETLFYPHVDYMVDRETIDKFKPDKEEPVGVIMGAWYMWNKWNWPPSKYIVPHMIAYHHYDRSHPLKACPITTEHYTGPGGEWMKAYGPVGCRDLDTMDVLDKMGIDNYFSGCVTLTLPKQKKTADCGKYICLVDLNPKVEAKIRQIVGDKYEIRKLTHSVPRKSNASWEEKAKDVIDVLTIYQNAAYVVTRRLHVALPCLAMETPVLVVIGEKMNDPKRFKPYDKWLNYVLVDDFLKGKYEFDFDKGTPNRKEYLETRKKLIKSCKDFVAYCEKNSDKTVDELNKTKYTRQELLEWQNNLMCDALKKMSTENRKLYDKMVKQKSKKVQIKEESKLVKKIKKYVPEPIKNTIKKVRKKLK